MEFERSKVSRVAADTAAAAHFQYQFELPDPASLQLPDMALMVVVRVSVLAAPRAEGALLPAQKLAANDAARRFLGLHAHTLLACCRCFHANLCCVL
jgi:hypothetical protein